MPINLEFGGGGNEYQAEAEQMMNQARNRGPGGPSPIAVVLDVLGIGRQVARPPKGKSSETGDLASQEAAPTSQTVDVVDKKGNVLEQVEQAIANVGESTNVSRLPLAPLELSPTPFGTSGQGIPRPLSRIDPTTGQPL